MLDDNNNDNSEIEIDQNDLIIIRDTQNWKPTKKFIKQISKCKKAFPTNNSRKKAKSITKC